MSEIPLCSIVISSELPTNEIESLETSLRISSIQVQKQVNRVFGAYDIVFIATVLGGLAATANLIEYGIKIAKSIISWRNQLRSRGIEPVARLEHPDRAPLDLDNASDEEIEEWFSQQ